MNSVVLMGRLTHSPELKHTPSDVAVVKFTLAVDRGYSKNSEEKVTDFIDIVAWRNTAEFVCKYFKKGQLVAVEGSLQVRNYEGRDGNKRKAFEIVASQVHFAESKKENKEFEYDNKPQSYSNGSNNDFIEIQDDLPF